MKKILITAFAIVSGLVSFAGQYPSNIIGVRAGLNVSTMNRCIIGSDGTRISLNDNRRPKVGWNLGVVDQILLLDAAPLYLEPAVFLTNKGSGYMRKVNGTKNIYRLGATYLQIPVSVAYHIYAGNFTIQPRAGLYYALGLWARDVTVDKAGSKSNKVVVNPYDNDATIMGRSDFGVQVGLGATYMDHYYFGLEWESGFVNMSKIAGRKDTNISNFKIEFGYNF